MPSLEDHTARHRSKLARRLERQGISSIAGLSYDQYLRSTLWKEIREWVIKAQGGRCSICDRQAEEVHHHDYTDKTMWGEKSEGLVGLCSRCHNLVEFDGDRVKRDCLTAKRGVFEYLQSTFEIFRREGFCLSLSQIGLSTTVKYTGNPAFLKFHDCSALAYEFIASLNFGEIIFPLPLGREKLAQKSGVKLSLRCTKKHVATICSDSESITIKRTKACSYPIQDHFQKFLREKLHVIVRE